MAELKAKITLKQKGEEAYLSIKQITAVLRWTAPVDLDLMAFYRAKDGRTGGIFSDNYAGGSMGSLNSFPFIQLSGDAGVGATGGDNEEVLRITKLDELAEVYICTLNYTDAVQNRPAAFSRYDAHVVVTDDHGESVAVPLDSPQPGAVAVIARLDNTSFMGAKLINENRILDLESFRSTVPGAAALQIASKIILKRKGETVELRKLGGPGAAEIVVNLNWNQGAVKPAGFLSKVFSAPQQGVDLDLGCLYELRSGAKGAIQALGKNFGNYERPPYILHLGDDRTGAWAEGENLRINGAHVAEIKRVLIYAFIYEGVANWAQADGVVTVKQPGGPDIVVQLDEHRNDLRLCAIALIENAGNTFRVQRLVQYFPDQEAADRAFGWGMRWVPGRKD